MTPFRTQLEAIGSALLHIQKLPKETVWSLICTDDDTAQSPSSLTIYTPADTWDALTALLKLRSRPTEDLPTSRAYQQGTLYITFTEE
jgi:hypothetical protein